MGNNYITINLYLNEFEEQEEDNNVTFDPNEFPLKYDGNYRNGPVAKSFDEEGAYRLFFAYYGYIPSNYITVECSDKNDKIVEISNMKSPDYYVEEERIKDIKIFLVDGKLKYSENIANKYVSITLKTEKGHIFRCHFSPDQPPVQ
jgi:hypothetical protein|nr:MAG TPA: hypothetical protein [Caudoviricetes sp.]